MSRRFGEGGRFRGEQGRRGGHPGDRRGPRSATGHESPGSASGSAQAMPPRDSSPSAVPQAPQDGAAACAGAPAPLSVLGRPVADAAVLEPLHLKPREERRLLAGHLWAFSNEIDWERTPRPLAGETRRLLSARGQDLGWADINPHTLIAARLQPVLPSPLPTAAQWAELVARSLADRARWLGRNDFCRVINADGDGLPGLTLDRYGDRWVLAAQTAAMEARAPALAEALLGPLGAAGVFRAGSTRARELEGLPQESSWEGDSAEVAWVPVADGADAACPLGSGQKTGFFLDQAVNRRRLAPLARGLTMLDACSYTGGWGLAAAAAGSTATTFVDRDAEALDWVLQGWRRAKLPGEPERRQGDVFDVLEDFARAGRRFGMVVLDPPAFAKSRKTVDQALLGYQRLARLGLRVLEPGGILVACSCSGLVPEDEFRAAVHRASRQERRALRLIDASGASPDHPVHPAMPETRYLKVHAYSPLGE